MTRTIAASAYDAWDVISELDCVERYLPAVSSSEVNYRKNVPVRTIALLDGTHYEEALNKIDEVNRTICYTIFDPSPFPYSRFKGTITVKAIDENTCEICWSASYCTDIGSAQAVDTVLTLIMSLAVRGIERECKHISLSCYELPSA